MSLLVYAVCAEVPHGIGRRRGTDGERLRAVSCGDLHAVVGDVSGPPPIDARTLRTHERVVRGLAAVVEAILPVRFGSLLADEAGVVAILADRRRALRSALALVAGREQMTLRVFARFAGADPPGAAMASDDLTGAAYLVARRRAHQRARTVPEIAWLRPALRPLVSAERVQRHGTPPLLATVYHLIPRGRAAAYRAVIARASRRRPAVHVVVSGPWAPWAFADPDVA